MSLRKIIGQYKNPIAEVGTGVALGGGVTAATSDKENKKLKAGLGALAGGLSLGGLGKILRSRAALGDYASKVYKGATDRADVGPYNIREDLLEIYKDKKSRYKKDLARKAGGFNPFALRTKKIKESMPDTFISQKRLKKLKDLQGERDLQRVFGTKEEFDYEKALNQYYRSMETVFAKMDKDEVAKHMLRDPKNKGVEPLYKELLFTKPVFEFPSNIDSAAKNITSNKELFEQFKKRAVGSRYPPLQAKPTVRNLIKHGPEIRAKKRHERRMASLRKRFPDRGIE